MIDLSSLQNALDDWRLRSDAPGVAAALRVNGELAWSGSSSDEPFSPTPRFPIYSITKPLTAICIFRLHERGMLSITSPVTQVLPDIPISDEITLTHLLQHTSGLGDYGPLREYHDAVRANPGTPWTEPQFLAAVLPRGPLFAPGAGWAYSNIGYMLIRLVLEKTTGMTFTRCIEEFIVSPLNLQETFVAEEISDWASCVPGYGTEVSSDKQLVDIRPVYHPGWAAPGGAVSTPEETTLIFECLFAGQLLSETTLRMMLTLVPVPGSHPPTVTPSSGLGILGDPDSPFGPSYGHGGGGPGYSLNVTVLPNAAPGRLILATFVNTSQGQDAQSAEIELLKCLMPTIRGT